MYSYLKQLSRVLVLLLVLCGTLVPNRAVAQDFVPKWIDYAQLDFGTYARCAKPSCKTTFPTRGNRWYGALEGSVGRLSFGLAAHGYRAIAMGYGGHVYVRQYSLGIDVTDNISAYAIQGDVNSNYQYARDYSVLGLELSFGDFQFAGEHQRAKTHYFEPKIKQFAGLWQAGEATSIYATYWKRGLLRHGSLGVHYEGPRLTLDAVNYFYHSDFGNGNMWVSARYGFKPRFSEQPFSVFGSLGFSPNYVDQWGVYTLGLGAPIAQNTFLEFTYSGWYAGSISNTEFANIGIRLRYKFGRKRKRVLDQITDYVREAREPYLVYYDTTPLSRGLFGYVGRYLPIE
ncbi:MAG: hypothetical protein BM560_15485 [Roseobacter sp. MedPE-SWde]|nr:MAG: hypothetical protein BM560_15485 [Roseobacter sp. MedPE-SWde]